MGPFQMMRYGHCKNRYGDVVVGACGNIVVSWCQHVDPEDLDNILTTWCYGMTNVLRAEASQNSVADNAA